MWTGLKHLWLWLLGILVPLAVVCVVLVVGNDGRVGPFWAKYRQVEIGMSNDQVIAILGPPSDEDHSDCTFGEHFFWKVPDGTVEVFCDIEGIVYDKKAPRETWWERLQRMLRNKIPIISSRYLAAVLGILAFLLPALLVARSWRSEPISPAGFRRIHLGMTPNEVETAIGMPAGNYYTRHPQYGSASGPFVEPLRELGIPLVDFTDAINGQGEEPRERLIPRMWCGNTYCIWVAFDERGVAVGAFLLKTVSGRDSALTAFGFV
jgi:hypothetical protein